MVFRNEGPIEGPSCWPTVTVAEATPASCGATPYVPVLIDGAMTMPRPTPVRMIGPSTPAAYPVCTPRWASQVAAPAATSIPAVTISLGPTLGISTIVDMLAATAMPPANGRNAKPVTTGEGPQ